jgi:hypothetical protein
MRRCRFGPKTLCAEKTKKSASSAVTLTGGAGGLRPVDEDGHAPCVRKCDDLLNRIDRPKRIRDVCQSDEFCARPEQSRKLVENQFAAIIYWRHPDGSAHLVGEQLPRNDIRVVLHLSQYDLVACADVLPAVALGHKVHGLGGATQKTISFASAAPELTHFLTSGFQRARRARREGVRRAMNVLE